MTIDQMNWIVAEIMIAAWAGYQGPISWAARGASISLPAHLLNVYLTPDGSRTRVSVISAGPTRDFDTMDEALDTL